MLHKFRFVIAGVLIIAANQAVNYAVSAATAGGLLPAGTTRYAAVSGEDQVSVSSSTPSTIPGMSTKITIPSGKHGDVMMWFCADTLTAGGGVYVDAYVGGTLAKPAGSALTADNVTGPVRSRCLNFFVLNAAAGTKTVKLVWSTLAGTQYLSARSLLVLVNIH